MSMYPAVPFSFFSVMDELGGAASPQHDTLNRAAKISDC
jgi:hypothetical protein